MNLLSIFRNMNSQAERERKAERLNAAHAAHRRAQSAYNAACARKDTRAMHYAHVRLVAATHECLRMELANG